MASPFANPTQLPPPPPPPYSPPRHNTAGASYGPVVSHAHDSRAHIPAYVPMPAHQAPPFGQQQPHGTPQHQIGGGSYQGINLMQQSPFPTKPQPQFPPPPTSSTASRGASTSSSFTLGGPTTYSYVSVPGSKYTRVLLPPQGTEPLFTVVYPSSLSPQPQILFTRNDGSELATATLHNITSERVDVAINPGADGGGVAKYKFKKGFQSQTGLGTRQMVWGKEKDGPRDLVLVEGGIVKDEKWKKMIKEQQKKIKKKMGQNSSEDEQLEEGVEAVAVTPADVIARFVPRGGKVGGSDRIEGWFDMCRPGGLNQRQFEEVFVSAVAEIERRRRDAEGWETIETVLALV